MSNKKLYTEIILSFCSTDELRGWLQTPIRIGNRIHATDAHILASIDLDKLDTSHRFNYDSGEKLKNVLITDRNQNLSINVKEMNKVFSNAPQQDCYDTVGKDIDCSECEGDGEVLWQYNDTEKFDSCPVCDGDGRISLAKQIKNGKTEIKDHLKIEIGISTFQVSLFQKLLDVANKLNIEIITLIYQKEEMKGSLFNIGDFEILLMPTKKGNDDLMIDYDKLKSDGQG